MKTLKEVINDTITKAKENGYTHISKDFELLKADVIREKESKIYAKGIMDKSINPNEVSFPQFLEEKTGELYELTDNIVLISLDLPLETEEDKKEDEEVVNGEPNQTN
jgi:hypothetical protein